MYKNIYFQFWTIICFSFSKSVIKKLGVYFSFLFRKRSLSILEDLSFITTLPAIPVCLNYALCAFQICGALVGNLTSDLAFSCQYFAGEFSFLLRYSKMIHSMNFLRDTSLFFKSLQYLHALLNAPRKR